jgi:hypothetical protein
MRRAYIDLQFAPHWELIDPAREFLLRFFSIVLKDDRIGGEVCLAAHELMENAIKYSPNDEAKVEIEVNSDGAIHISVENQAQPEQIARLDAEIGAACAAVDPLAYYRLKMEESVERTDGKSCLGLARIRCEANMMLSYRVEGDRVRVTATRGLDDVEMAACVDKPAEGS